jgi:hypothetical protein
MYYTGRFKVKYAVQQRLTTASHPDSEYAFYQFQMLKKMAVKLREDSVMVCLDDKAIIPVGEPGNPVSTSVRAHNRSLVPNNVKLVALDHDFHIHGAVPSVLFNVDIPVETSDSFYEGTIHVTVKDKVFEPSSAVRHTTESLKILRKVVSSDNVTLNVPVLFTFTDGGPDHRSTYWSVQLGYILLFIALDLDLLVSARTAPSRNYANPAERCMSLLNPGLQNVSLERGRMSENEELRVKSLSTMKSRRDIATRQPALKEAMVSSVEPVLAKLKQRFQRLKLHDEKVQVHDAATDDEISMVCELVDIFRNDRAETHLTVDDVSVKKNVVNYPKLTYFVEKHCRARQYSYQVLYHNDCINDCSQLPKLYVFKCFILCEEKHCYMLI